jgi:hypothetical protein
MNHDPSRFSSPLPVDPEIGKALARAAFVGLDRLLATQPVCEHLPAGEIAALVRLIRDAADLCPMKLTGSPR